MQQSDPITFKEPTNVKIIKNGDYITITQGRCAKQSRNMYWQVQNDKNETFYIIHITDTIYTKVSNEDIEKVFNYKGKRPVWYLMASTGYIATSIKVEDEKRIIYLHQYIMNTHNTDNTDLKQTVDHINQDNLDNRKENLRIVDMSEQNKNKAKQKRSNVRNWSKYR